MKWTHTILAWMLVFGSSVAINSKGPPKDQIEPVGSHFQHVLIIVLENQSYVNAIKDGYLKELAEEGVDFTNFHALGHPSYPNYLAMISGSTFGIHGMFGDNQRNFPDDKQHRTIADYLDWKNYAEDYPVRDGQRPFLGDTAGLYARKHVPFLSFEKLQSQSASNVASVDTRDTHNAFVTDVENSRKEPNDPKYKPLPTYMFYSPNLDDDGHDTNVSTASGWLKNFMTNWFPAAARKGTLIVVTFDESERPEWDSNHIYTVFLGDMVKKGDKVNQRFDHFDVLRTVEANFGIAEPLNVGDSKATVIKDIWN